MLLNPRKLKKNLSWLNGLVSVCALSLIVLLTGCSADPRIIGPDQRVLGIVFWEFPAFRSDQPISDQPTRGFHWNGAMVHAWGGESDRNIVFSIVVSKCSGLDQALIALRSSLVPSATKIILDTRRKSEIVIWHGSSFRLQLASFENLGVLTLDAVEPYSSPWVMKAQKVQSLLMSCHLEEIGGAK